MVHSVCARAADSAGANAHASTAGSGQSARKLDAETEALQRTGGIMGVFGSCCIWVLLHLGPWAGPRRLSFRPPPRADKRVSASLQKEIVKGRMAKKMTQAQLAQAVNERVSVIQSYEKGDAIPNPNVLAKLSRALGVTLRKSE
jgi:putative transcription factor